MPQAEGGCLHMPGEKLANSMPSWRGVNRHLRIGIRDAPPLLPPQETENFCQIAKHNISSD